MYVYLIGAGPGDPGLITLRGLRALERADAVVYDFLSSEELLAHARPDAELIYVGKKAGNHALPQPEINRLLVRLAKEGKVVARLKGGDPYIFGRGGEEGEELFDAGVPFEEIPGISSTIAGPAYAGIPLTHRTLASSVTLITGHEDPTKPGSVHDWEALARSASTLVFVMGMKNLPEISRNLISAGMSPETPAALIHWGTTDHQRSLVSTIGRLPDDAVREGFANPSVIVVGQVVTMRGKLNWFERKPLFGRTVLITRAREQASESAARFAELGARVIQFPTIAVRPLPDDALLDQAIARLASYDWVVFTSANGVKHFARRLNALGLDARAFGRAKIAVIGPATAERLRALGLRPDFIPARHVAERAAEGLIALGMTGRRVLLPRAFRARDILPAELAKAGAEVDDVPAYETVAADNSGLKEKILAELEAGTLSCITFGSSSTVRNFLAAVSAETLKAHPETKLASIGPITSAALRDAGLEPDIEPEEYTIPGLVKAVCAALCA